MQTLKIADRTFTSRLFTGTGKFSSNEQMRRAILASESELVTVALKRVELDDANDDILAHLRHEHIHLLPNTSGVRNAREAVFAAQLAREALQTPTQNICYPTLWRHCELPKSLLGRDSSYCHTFRQTPSCVNCSKERERQP